MGRDYKQLEEDLRQFAVGDENWLRTLFDDATPQDEVPSLKIDLVKDEVPSPDFETINTNSADNLNGEDSNAESI